MTDSLAGDHTGDGGQLTSGLQGTVVAILAEPGNRVVSGAPVLLIESMKLHHEISAPVDLEVVAVVVEVGQTVERGDVLCRYRSAPAPSSPSSSLPPAAAAADTQRADLSEVLERHRLGSDAARGEAIGRRHARNRRSARANIADLLDPDSFVEYGPLVIAAQRRRRDLGDLIANTPADGLIAGLGRVNSDLFEGRATRCVAMSYDYTVLAGTQGTMNHRKKDRLFELAERLELPVVVFAEGGGGRPGDTEAPGISGLDCLAFEWFARLSGLVPLVGIASGYCFAGNAALLGCCDVIIATPDANIGMGGPAMIEGGGLGTYHPSEIGPASVQVHTGVVDVLVDSEAEAVRVARRSLAYFQGPLDEWSAPDQTELRSVVPVDRLRSYDVRRAIELLFDTDSVTELRRGFGLGMITALARIEGRAVGVIANDPSHLAGAIDADGADKAARFMQLCDAFGLSVVTLVDTPGMMVGPEAEASGLVRHCSRLFVTGANLQVPIISVVLRKAYGLGAQAMMGGTTKAPIGCVAWPTGEFGGMGLEGAVRLGYRRELEEQPDEVARRELFERLVAGLYEHGRAVSVASYFEIDDAIDPASTRTWIAALLESSPSPQWAPRSARKRRPNIDTW